ncbi:hypothetical protein DN745_06640 [Bradymonas sediminis]|uniref:PEGA domain-containing protein n=2 Tax=Bradymonas sediminis TaxID=1548548 RepID=A0A2Z4FJB6_9DELT|nr:hypothetical protein DN745_06640 [Bradymonas sediminis]
MIALCALALPLASATQAHAQSTPKARHASSQDSRYAQYFGDGLREFGEGNFERAIPNLLRAYALDSRAETLGLVISAYDKMGYCDAALRQLEVFESAHARASAPGLAECAKIGTVQLECVGAAGALAGESAQVNGRFEVTCGEAVRLPAGEHAVAVGEGASEKSRRKVRVLEGETVSLRLESIDPPKRWRPVTPEVSQLPDLPAYVERVPDAGFSYSVFLTQDGIYRVFVQAAADQPPAYFDLPFRPNILRLCDSGERYDRRLHECVPMEGLNITKFK